MSQISQILNYVKNITETLNQWIANAKKTEELPAATVVDPDNLLMISVFEDGVWVSKKIEIEKIIQGLSLSGQDNKIREVLLGTITEEDTLNYLLDNTGITVTESEIIVLSALVTIDNQLVQRQFLWKKGKGEYNPIGSTDINDKLLELQPKFLSEINADELTNSPRAIVYDFGVITDPILDVLNTASPARDYTDDERIYYIRATKDGVNLLYNFIGVNGIYGDGELQMTEDDLVLVYSSSNTDISTLLNSKTDRGGYTGTAQALANRIGLLENFKKDQAESGYIDLNLSGVVIDLDISTGGQRSLNFTGSITELHSLFFPVNSLNDYDGLDVFVRNSQSESFVIKHESGNIATENRFIFSFPDEQDLEVLPKQIIQFKLKHIGGTSRGKIEFVGLKGVDESNLMHLDGDEDVDGNKKFLQPVSGVEAVEDEHFVTKGQLDAGLGSKLDAADYNDRFKGVYLTEAALNAAHPTANAGDSAQVNEVGSTKVINYSWDAEDNVWVNNGSGGSGATNTDALPEGSSNLYFTTARVLATVLTGISFATGGAIVSTDSILVAFGKLQKQISDLLTAVGGKQDALVSGTSIKTINGESILGSGDMVISSGASEMNYINNVTTEFTGVAITPILVHSFMIPANTLSDGDLIIIEWINSRIVTGSNVVKSRIYINSSGSLTGATQIAMGGAMSSSTNSGGGRRLVSVKDTSFVMYQTATTETSSDVGNTHPLSYTIDRAGDIYILFTGICNSSSDTGRYELASLRILKN